MSKRSGSKSPRMPELQYLSIWRNRYHVWATQSLSISKGIRFASSSGTLNGGKDGPWVTRKSLDLKNDSGRTEVVIMLVNPFNAHCIGVCVTWRWGHRWLCSTALRQVGGVSSWPAFLLLSSSTAAWESSGRTPTATPQTGPPLAFQPVSLLPQLKNRDKELETRLYYGLECVRSSFVGPDSVSNCVNHPLLFE